MWAIIHHLVCIANVQSSVSYSFSERVHNLAWPTFVLNKESTRKISVMMTCNFLLAQQPTAKERFGAIYPISLTSLELTYGMFFRYITIPYRWNHDNFPENSYWYKSNPESEHSKHWTTYPPYIYIYYKLTYIFLHCIIL